MGYLGARTRLLPEIIKKYAYTKWALIGERSGYFKGDALDLYNEVDDWFSECELYDNEDYPGLTVDQLLPERVVELRNEYYDSL